MKTYTTEELKEVLEKHREWRLDKGGKCANLEGANLQGAYLRGAYLREANLQGAYLRGAYLREANLREANLEEAYLAGANLQGAYLAGANLQGAYLEEAYLAGANLQGAYLAGANLRGANLEEAYLAGANLQGANLAGVNLQGVKEIPIDMQNYFKKDLLYVLQNCPIKDVEQLKERIVNGKINGSQYHGECACLIGSLYQIEGLRNEIEFAKSHIPYYGCGLHNPSEQLFYQIKEGDKPADNQFSEMALDVIEVYLNAK